MEIFSVDKTPFTLEIAFDCSEYIFIIGIAPIEIFLICCQNPDENYVWHLMLNYSSSYLHMLKSTHLKHLNPLYWRHNDNDGVSNHQPHVCLRNRLFRRRSKKTSKLRVTGICVGNSPGPVNSPHKGPVTRKMFPFDDVIMHLNFVLWYLTVYVCT